jgi:hypothetical protein
VDRRLPAAPGGGPAGGRVPGLTANRDGRVELRTVRSICAMADIRSPRWLYIKGGLFLGLGLLASALLLLESPSIRVAILLAVAVWAFARSYYFAFYVVEHYIDDGYKFAGLLSFLRHVMRRRRRPL